MSPEIIKAMAERMFIPPEVYTHPDVKALCRSSEKRAAEECVRILTAAADAIRRQFEVNK